MSGFVSVREEPLFVRVGSWLLRHGCVPADDDWVARDPPQMIRSGSASELCFLSQESVARPVKGLLGRLLRRKPLRIILGVIRFEGLMFGADPDSKWVILVQGKDNLERVRALAMEMGRAFEVDISLEVVPHTETLYERF